MDRTSQTTTTAIRGMSMMPIRDITTVVNGTLIMQCAILDNETHASWRTGGSAGVKLIIEIWHRPTGHRRTITFDDPIDFIRCQGLSVDDPRDN